jgi:hypothetical protein
MTEQLYVDISVCSICDKDRDPLDVPEGPCGHHRDNGRIVPVPVVPQRDFDALVAERDLLRQALEQIIEVELSVHRGEHTAWSGLGEIARLARQAIAGGGNP